MIEVMNVKDIKLRRVKGDDGKMRYHHEGTEFLKPMYAVKGCYDYDIYIDGKRHFLGRYEYVRTLADVKKWIANYDLEHLTDLHCEALEHNEWVDEMRERKERETNAVKKFLADENNGDINVGDMIVVTMGKLSKPNHLGEALANTNLPRNAKVVHITEVTCDEYDAAVKSLYNGFKKEWLKLAGETEHEFGGGYVGGCNSDDPRLENIENFDEIYHNPELKLIWDRTYYELVHLITAPGKNPIVVNTEGYGYPRYAGCMV